MGCREGRKGRRLAGNESGGEGDDLVAAVSDRVERKAGTLGSRWDRASLAQLAQSSASAARKRADTPSAVAVVDWLRRCSDSTPSVRIAGWSGVAVDLGEDSLGLQVERDLALAVILSTANP